MGVAVPGDCVRAPRIWPYNPTQGAKKPRLSAAVIRYVGEAQGPVKWGSFRRLSREAYYLLVPVFGWSNGEVLGATVTRHCDVDERAQGIQRAFGRPALVLGLVVGPAFLDGLTTIVSDPTREGAEREGPFLRRVDDSVNGRRIAHIQVGYALVVMTQNSYSYLHERGAAAVRSQCRVWPRSDRPAWLDGRGASIQPSLSCWF